MVQDIRRIVRQEYIAFQSCCTNEGLLQTDCADVEHQLTLLSRYEDLLLNRENLANLAIGQQVWYIEVSDPCAKRA